MDERVVRARELYEQAVFAGTEGVLAQADEELDAVEADLALARGRVLHGRFLACDKEDPAELPLFQRSAELYRKLGDTRGEAEALFWIGCFYQVVWKDADGAVDALERSAELAREVGDRLTLSYALRHLGIAAQQAGQLDTARTLLEESTTLRRDLGFHAGVAANLVGLIYLAAAQNRTTDAHHLADEATALAQSAGATTILTQLTEARRHL
ncbi:tetratricopeptide repeat protein [Kribbella voronezhensis]|uniref:Tetratricopeptide repeat protein n=1 Tax=Kribbella voronezhensis TaxID=2512212 RepID=A0A4V3FIW5_9ACTN|nr:tetratricopeptide repeat protein [Kribbella voronezhensis]TDU84083.1 tetratricopeptide repeat protein [Kribbella voronezhensis]